MGGRGRQCRPVNDAGTNYELVTQLLRVAHKQSEQGVLRAELEAERPVEIDVALQVATQHDNAPATAGRPGAA